MTAMGINGHKASNRQERALIGHALADVVLAAELKLRFIDRSRFLREGQRRLGVLLQIMASSTASVVPGRPFWDRDVSFPSWHT